MNIAELLYFAIFDSECSLQEVMKDVYLTEEEQAEVLAKLEVELKSRM